MIRSLFALLLLATVVELSAQQNSDQTPLPLNDMSAFEAQSGNWFVAGEVLMDPSVDIHQAHPEPKPVPEEPAGKKKRKKRNKQEEAPAPVPPAPKAVVFQPGSGILLNMNNDSIKDNLLTRFQHGDILLDLEVMIPKGSNSGIYLQGRYEVQLLDSWGVKDPKFGDIGGIYRNWESEKGKIYMGKAPLTNAAKAPGLWQHFSIAFQAPKFDAQGRKIANARFIYVDLNGVRIHENLEVPLPTGGPVENNEVPFGPLMIQGDHGPVALRNIRYQLLEEQDLSLANVTYHYFPGPVADFEALQSMEPMATGSLPQLTVQTGQPTESFGMVIQGAVVAPKAGSYKLRLNYNGSAKLEIAGKTLSGNYQIDGEQSVTVNLRQGDNPFTISYYKSDAWFDAALGLFETGSFPRPLHAYNSFPLAGRQAPPIHVSVGNQPRLLRAFLDFDRDRKRRLTHTLGVGTPGGMHYIYDLKAGAPVCVWRGEFINATPMWNSRGDGSFRPRGAVQYLFTGPAIAQLASADVPFPAAVNEFGDLKGKGYRIAKDTHLPVFLYFRDSLELEDEITPDLGGNAWMRTIKVTTDAAPEGLYVKMAEGEQIQQLPDGTYVIDQSYYIRLHSAPQAQIRKQGAGQELIAPLSKTDLSYTINW